MESKKVKILSNSLISGDSLTIQDSQKIASAIPEWTFMERVKLLYKYSGTFDKAVELKDEVYVGVTNFRVFRLENGECQQVYRENIGAVRHIKEGPWTWDQAEVTLITGASETFRVYHSTACEYICKELSNNRNAEREYNIACTLEQEIMLKKFGYI